MTLSPTKLADARIAAAEVFIADGLAGTNWGDREDADDTLRRVAEAAPFFVRYVVHERGTIDVRVDERRGRMFVDVEPVKLGRLSPDDAERAALLLQRAIAVARKVEAAIAEVVR